NDIKWTLALLACLFGVRVDEIDDAFDQSMRQALLDRGVAPGFLLYWHPGFGFDCFGKINQAFGRIIVSIEQHVLHSLTKCWLDLFIDRKLSRVDDAHVESCSNRMKEERSMHRLAHGIITAKRKGNVTHSAADPCPGQIGLDPTDRLDEIDRVISMFVQTGSDSQNIRIENDVVRGKMNALGQEPVGALADFDAPLQGISLAFFVERHDDDGCAIAPNECGVTKKFLLAIFQAE